MKPRTFKTIILEDLRKRGLHTTINKIKSITYETFSMGNAVRVQTENLFKSERTQLETILQGYAYGRFDAMTDCSSSECDETMERQAKYVTLVNEFSQAVKDAAKLRLKRDHGIIDEATSQAKFGTWYDQMVWRELCAAESFDQVASWCA